MSGLFLGAQLRTTWANRPTPAELGAGRRVTITDVGAGGESDWVSDGTILRPLNGQVVLHSANSSNAAPLATLTFNGTNQTFALPLAALIPAGMLIAGAALEIGFFGRKNGTETSPFMVQLAATAAATGAPVIGSAATNANDNSIWRGSIDVTAHAGGFFTTGGVSLFGNISGTVVSTAVDREDANISTEDRFVTFGFTSSATTGSATIQQYFVKLRF